MGNRIRLKIDDLTLWDENPRFYNPNEIFKDSEIINKIFESCSDDQMLNIIADIARDGLMQSMTRLL